MTDMKNFVVVGIFVNVLILGCRQASIKETPVTAETDSIAKQIADGLHSPEGLMTSAIIESLESLQLPLDSSTTQSLVLLYWDDRRPSACDQVWSIYTVSVPERTGVSSDTDVNRGGTVGDFIYHQLDELTSSKTSEGITKKELRNLLKENGYNLDLVRQLREKASVVERVPSNENE